MRKFGVDITDKESGGVRVIISGDLTIKNCSEIRNKLMEVKTKYTLVELEVKEVTRLDLSVIQVLHSLKSSMTIDQRSIQFKIELTPELSETIEKCGLNYFKA